MSKCAGSGIIGTRKKARKKPHGKADQFYRYRIREPQKEDEAGRISGEDGERNSVGKMGGYHRAVLSGRKTRQTTAEHRENAEDYLLQNWFSLSDEGIEDAIYDSYAMKQFMGVNFGANKQVPDATTLCKFRQLLNAHGIPERLFAEVQDILSSEGKMVHGGSIVDATIGIVNISAVEKSPKNETE